METFTLLFQPVELLIIGRATCGAFLISIAFSLKKLLGMTIKGLLGVLTGKGATKESYLKLLSWP